MRYFIVNTTIRDGEYEYMSQSPIQAKTDLQAIHIATVDAQEWTQDDYREFEIVIHSEITKEEYLTIKKYIY